MLLRSVRLPVWSGGAGLSAVSYMKGKISSDNTEILAVCVLMCKTLETAIPLRPNLAISAIMACATRTANRTHALLLGLLTARSERPSHVLLRHLPHTPCLYPLSRLSASLQVAPVCRVSTLPMHHAEPVLLPESWLEASQP
jgi:hypothetical protein